MKQYLIQINGPSVAYKVLVNAGENVPMAVIENAVLQAVQEQQFELAKPAVQKHPLAPAPRGNSWGLN